MEVNEEVEKGWRGTLSKVESKRTDRDVRIEIEELKQQF